MNIASEKPYTFAIAHEFYNLFSVFVNISHFAQANASNQKLQKSMSLPT